MPFVLDTKLESYPWKILAGNKLDDACACDGPAVSDEGELLRRRVSEQGLVAALAGRHDGQPLVHQVRLRAKP